MCALCSATDLKFGFHSKYSVLAVVLVVVVFTGRWFLWWVQVWQLQTDQPGHTGDCERMQPVPVRAPLRYAVPGAACRRQSPHGSRRGPTMTATTSHSAAIDMLKATSCL